MFQLKSDEADRVALKINRLVDPRVLDLGSPFVLAAKELQIRVHRQPFQHKPMTVLLRRFDRTESPGLEVLITPCCESGQVARLNLALLDQPMIYFPFGICCVTPFVFSPAVSVFGKIIVESLNDNARRRICLLVVERETPAIKLCQRSANPGTPQGMRGHNNRLTTRILQLPLLEILQPRNGCIAGAELVVTILAQWNPIWIVSTDALRWDVIPAQLAKFTLNGDFAHAAGASI